MKLSLNPDTLQLDPMSPADLEEVLDIENAVYPFPWTQGNFADSLKSGYDAWTLRLPTGAMLGYFVLMHAVHETHLLNVAVAAEFQGIGLGRYLMEVIAARGRGHMMESVLLEVRPSNTRALQIYARSGYKEIGRRKNYYPAGPGQREDAIIMRFDL